MKHQKRILKATRMFLKLKNDSTWHTSLSNASWRKKNAKEGESNGMPKTLMLSNAV
jgi:P pilus assembly chaperone PapD